MLMIETGVPNDNEKNYVFNNSSWLRTMFAKRNDGSISAWDNETLLQSCNKICKRANDSQKGGVLYNFAYISTKIVDVKYIENLYRLVFVVHHYNWADEEDIFSYIYISHKDVDDAKAILNSDSPVIRFNVECVYNDLRESLKRLRIPY